VCINNNCCATKLVLWHTCPNFDVYCFWDNLQMTQNVWTTFYAFIKQCSTYVSAFQINVNSNRCRQEAIHHKFLYHLGWGDWLFHHEIVPTHRSDQHCFHNSPTHFSSSPSNQSSPSIAVFLKPLLNFLLPSSYNLIHFMTSCSHLDHGLPLWHFPV
jgi:hypothetical protein